MNENWFKKNEEDLKKIGVREYSKGNLVLFNSYKRDGSEVVSNFNWDCEIWVNGMVFKSVEQLYYCIVYGDSVGVCEEIMRCGSGSEIKKVVKGYGRELGVLDNMRILRFCIRLKYLYNERFRRYFLSNISKTYVEDEYWSCDNLWGAKWDNERNCYRGYNITGRLYSELKKGVTKDDLWISEDWLLCGEKIDRDSIGKGYGMRKKMVDVKVDKEELMMVAMEGLI